MDTLELDSSIVIYIELSDPAPESAESILKLSPPEYLKSVLPLVACAAIKVEWEEGNE